MGFSAIGMVLLAGVLTVSRPVLAQNPTAPEASEQPDPARAEGEPEPPATPAGPPPPGVAVPDAVQPDARLPGPPQPDARTQGPGTRVPGPPPPVEPREPAGRAAGPGIRLVGVILEDGKAPVALIEIARTRQQALYRVGDEILEARVEKIFEDRAILRYQNQPLELRLAGGASASAPAARTPTPAPPPGGVPGNPPSTARLLELARRLRDNPQDAAAAEELRQLRAERQAAPRVSARDLAQSVAEPEVARAAVVEGGVRLTEVSQGGLLEGLGLRSGDVVRSVNRRPVGPERPLGQALAEAAAPGSERLRIEITRDGARRVLDQRLGP